MASSPKLVVFTAVAVLCHGFFEVAADSFEVRLNNTAPLADLVPVSTSSPLRLPPHHQDLFASASPSSPLHSVPMSKQPLQIQMHGRLSKFPPEASPKNQPPPGIRFRAPPIADDGNPTHLSVVWCGLLRHLGRSLLNRRTARSSHPAALAFGDIPALRRRLLHRRFLGGFFAIQVQEPFCNSTFFEGLICNSAA
jgi:hypothetical protein